VGLGAQKTAISPNGARKDQCYYDGLIGSRIRAFDWQQNQ